MLQYAYVLQCALHAGTIGGSEGMPPRKDAEFCNL